MEEYCKLENIFEEFNKQFSNEDDKFVFQKITLGRFIVWIHIFKNNVSVFECLQFHDKMSKKYELKNCSNSSCMERQTEHFKKDIKQIYQFFRTIRSEINFLWKVIFPR